MGITFTLCVTSNVTCIKLFLALPPGASEAFGSVILHGMEWLEDLSLLEDCETSQDIEGCTDSRRI